MMIYKLRHIYSVLKLKIIYATGKIKCLSNIVLYYTRPSSFVSQERPITKLEIGDQEQNLMRRFFSEKAEKRPGSASGSFIQMSSWSFFTVKKLQEWTLWECSSLKTWFLGCYCIQMKLPGPEPSSCWTLSDLLKKKPRETPHYIITVYFIPLLFLSLTFLD